VSEQSFSVISVANADANADANAGANTDDYDDVTHVPEIKEKMFGIEVTDAATWTSENWKRCEELLWTQPNATQAAHHTPLQWVLSRFAHVKLDVLELAKSYNRYIEDKKQIPVAGIIALSYHPLSESPEIPVGFSGWHALLIRPAFSTTTTTTTTTTPPNNTTTDVKAHTPLVTPPPAGFTHRHVRLTFPRGKMEPEDKNSLEATASREAWQEIGFLIDPHKLAHPDWPRYEIPRPNESTVHLFVVPNIRWDHPFQTRCRNEVERILWAPIVPNVDTQNLSSLVVTCWQHLLDYTATLRPPAADAILDSLPSPRSSLK
jgi:hypothetical protein